MAPMGMPTCICMLLAPMLMYQSAICKCLCHGVHELVGNGLITTKLQPYERTHLRHEQRLGTHPQGISQGGEHGGCAGDVRYACNRAVRLREQVLQDAVAASVRVCT